MERDGLPHLFISKLGHDIEEIRLRALNHLTFKLEHGLISHQELALVPDLISHLLRWFEFEPVREEEKVAYLLLALLTSNDEAKTYWHYLGVASQIRRIKDRLPTSVRGTLERISDILLDCNDGDTSKHVEFISPTSRSRSVETEEFPFTAFFEGEGYPDELQQLSYQVDHTKDKIHNRIGSTSKSVEPLLPRQPLSPGDSHVLASVEHSLTSGLDKHMKEVDNGIPKEADETENDREDTLIRCCQLVHDVILRDFLPEVFLQQPGIINVLLDLLTFLGDELDSNFADCTSDGKTQESLHWVMRCLQRLVTSLHSQLLFYADPSIPNAKDNNITSPTPSMPTPSSCSIIREPPQIFAGGQHRQYSGEVSPFTGHLSPPSEGSDSAVNAAAVVDDHFQFSLPRLCISILFQTLSLVASHLSGSHSKTFQSLMSLASLSINLFSSVVDPMMWTSVHPSCAIITGGISELFRVVGEVLLVYQGALSQRKDYSIPDSFNSQCSANDHSTTRPNDSTPDYESCRLAYLQLLFLTRSLLSLAPREPSLCRSAIPKELCLALVISIFDPPVQLMCPKLHEDLMKCVKVVSPEASKVCKQALLIGQSVASGIKLLKGSNGSLDGVNKALLGLPFHLSDDVVQKCWELCTSSDFDEVSSSAVGRTGKTARHPVSSETSKQTSSKSVLGSECSSYRMNEGGQRDGGKSVNTAISQTKLILSNKGDGSSRRSISSGDNHFSDVKEGMFSGSEQRTLTVLKLFAHESPVIRRQIYSFCWNMVKRILGTGSAKDFPGRSSSKRGGELKIKHLSFLWHRSVLTEIIAHGTTSSDDKIASNAKNIILVILKSKTSVAKRVWDDIIQAFLPTFPLLQSLADSVTPLGKSVTKMLDPDVSASLGVDMFQVLQGNCRLLYNPDGEVRTEAATRLAWMLSLENKKDGSNDDDKVIHAWKEIKNRLPDADLLASSGPSILSNAFVFKKSDHNINSHGNISVPQNQSETVVQLLSLVGKKRDGNVSLSDARLRRSALNQLALILEHNIHLHAIFLKNDGLNIVLKIFQGALVEVDYENYPECAVPAIAILKHIAHWNPNVRKELACAEVVYHCVLRATILFYAEDGYRNDAGHLLCLLLFSNYILLLIPSPPTLSPISSTLQFSARDPVMSLKSISLPHIVIQRMVFPFLCATHWRHSHHTSSSPLSPQLMGEREALIPGECISWSIIGGKAKPRDSLPWQGLVRLHGSWEWFGSEELVCLSGRKKITSLVPKDEVDFRLSCKFPPLLKMSSSEVNDLKATDIIGSCRSLLFQIQNATSHFAVESSLCMLTGYLSLWNESLTRDGALGFKNPETNPLPWSSTLGRFLSRSPASHQDSELLVQICTFLRSAVDGPASCQVFGAENSVLRKRSWLESLLQNPATLQPLLCPFNPPPPLFPDTVCSTQAFDGCPSRRAVCREVLSLIRDVAGSSRANGEIHEVGWAHAIYFITQSLQFGDAERFYDLAFLEWALSCLVQLTGTSGWCHGLSKVTEAVSKKRSLSQESIWEGLVSGLIELLTAFQHGGQSLPMWASEDARHEFQDQVQGSECYQDIRRGVSSEIPSEDSLPVTGSFMGLSITRSALLCLNHVLSGMQELSKKSTQVNWEMIWSKVLMNAGTSDSRVHGHRHGGVQSWLLPLWSSRDPFVRAAALQLASGIVAIPSPAHVHPMTKSSKRNRSNQQPTTEPPLGLRLLEEGLCGFAGGVWGATLSFFLDQCESNLVREHAALLLTNLISASGKIPVEILSSWVKEGVLFQEIGLVASQLFIGCSLSKLVSPSQTAVAEEETMREKKSVAWSTPGLVQAACKLLQNILALKPKVISSAMWEGNGFLFRRLFGCLGKIPAEEEDDHVATRLYVETLGLYSEILSLLASSLVWDPRLVSLLSQPVPLASVFMLLDSKKYRTEANLMSLKNKVWKKVFGFISSSLGAFIDHQGKSFPADDSVIAPERYYLTFLGAVHHSIIGGDPELRSSALCSLNALSAFELQHSMRQVDIPSASQHPGSKIPPLKQLLQCQCMEHEMKSDSAESSSQKSLRRGGDQEDLFSRSKFAFDVLHLLIALYEPERSSSAELSVALSSVLALSVQAKQCALASGLVEALVVKCRQLHASILLRETEDSLLTLPKLPKAALGKSQKSRQWMKDMKLLFRVLTNFLHSGDFGDKNKDAANHVEDNPVKLEAVRIGLPDVLHKLGTFAMLSTVLFSDFLRLVNTFTYNCPPACQSLVYTSRAMSVGPRQNLALSSLLHLLSELAPKETEALLLLQTTNQLKKGSNLNISISVDVLSLILSVLRNTCDVAECRMIMAKGGLLRSLIKLHPSEKRINNHLVNAVEQLWLHFLLYFTMYPEGQLSVPKVPEMFDLLLSLARKPAAKQESFLLVLRNLSFHPLNRARMLASDDFLELLIQVLNKRGGSVIHKEIAASAVWALAANNFKGKQILKGAGLDFALMNCLSHYLSADGGKGFLGKEGSMGDQAVASQESDIEKLLMVLNCALKVLGCDKEKRYSR